jgi:hypothetical protein
MVYIPRELYPESPPLPVFDLTAELTLNRINTALFIAQSPRRIVLTPRVRVRTAAGGSTTEDQAERPEQVFRLIQQSPSGASIEQRTVDGETERRIDWVLLGDWDAQVDVGDHWEEAGIWYEVMSLIPYNGYEVRANVEATGRRP